MRMKYQCCFCSALYDWYEGLQENPKYDYFDKIRAEEKGEKYNEEPGVWIPANSIILRMVEPIHDGIDDEVALEDKPVGGNLDVYLNICPDCMRKLLDNLHPYDEADAWSSI